MKNHFAWVAPDGWYSRWWRPADLSAEFDRETGGFKSDEFFSPRFQAARECYVASSFAGLLPDQPDVQLERSDFPDFRLRRASGAVELYEVTEALRPGRRRHDEYRNADVTIVHSEPDEDDALAVPTIQAAITKKAQKHYSQPSHLVVYADFSIRVADALAAAAFTDVSSFQTVHVLLFRRIVRLAYPM